MSSADTTTTAETTTAETTAGETTAVETTSTATATVIFEEEGDIKDGDGGSKRWQDSDLFVFATKHYYASRELVRQAIDNLSVPEWLKNLLRRFMFSEPSGKPACEEPAASCVPAPVKTECLPSETKAIETIEDFQKNQLKDKLLTLAQMGQMARTGYLTCKDGTTSKVPQDVQDAAKRYMADGAVLFRKMDRTAPGKQDSRPGGSRHREAVRHDFSALFNYTPKKEPIVCAGRGHALPQEAAAATTINDFQYRELSREKISIMQMEQMATTGYLNRKDGATVPVPQEVMHAAKRFMANDACLFRKLEAAALGRHDGFLCPEDYYEAIKCGKLLQPGTATVTATGGGCFRLPSEYRAARTMRDFQQDKLRGRKLSFADIAQVARTGYLSDGGKILAVSADVQNCAKRFMANDAALFNLLASVADGEQDGQLAAEGFDEAIQEGKLVENGLQGDSFFQHDDCTMPSSFHAANAIQDFQERKLEGGVLDIAELDLIARTGYLVRDEKTIAVYPEVQAAAQRFMANDADLFKILAPAGDGLLRTRDIHEAMQKETIRDDCGTSEVFSCTRQQTLPPEFIAAWTLYDFLSQHLQGARLTIVDMDSIACIGRLAKNGRRISVPDDVRLAARHFMANCGALFRSVDAAASGACDGELEVRDFQIVLAQWKEQDPSSENRILCRRRDYTLPSESASARIIHDFQEVELGGAPLCITDLDQMARTGYLIKGGKTHLVATRERDAARRFLADGADLFRKMESASGKEYDGQLATADYQEAITKGRIPEEHEDTPDAQDDPEFFLPLKSTAAQVIHAFQLKELQGTKLSLGGLKRIAGAGFLTRNGRTVRAPIKTRRAAKRFLANNEELFKEIEAACGRNDGLLEPGDYEKVIKAGMIRAL